MKVLNVIVDNFSLDNMMQYNNILFKKYRLSDIEKYPNKSFNYIVDEMSNTIQENAILSSTNDDIEIFPPEIIDCWSKYKNLNIILINQQESESFSIIQYLDNWTKKRNLNQKQLWLVNNNKRLYEYKKILKTDINFHISNVLFSIIDKKGISESDFTINKNGHFFMCYNKRAREHRVALLLLLKKKNILDNMDWSMLVKEDLQAGVNHNFNYDNNFCQIFTKDEFDELKSEIEYLKNIEIKNNIYEQNFDEIYKNYGEDIYHISHKKGFKNSYFNIITESLYEHHSNEYTIHISEKSFKPFYYFQFPLILAPPHHLKYLKKTYNFDLFEDIINHDYDNELDDKKRIIKFVEEIERINNNKDFFIEFYKNNKDRFIKNHRIVSNMSIEDDENEFYKKLINNTRKNMDKEIIASLEEWDPVIGFNRPNGSPKNWGSGELSRTSIPLMWGDWNVYQENGEMFDNLKDLVIPHRLDEFIKFIPINEIGNSNHLYIISVFHPLFFNKNKNIGFSGISDKYKVDIRNGKAKIIILYIMEGYSGSEGNDDLDIVEEWRIREDFPPKSVYFITGNLIVDQIAKNKDIEVIGVSNFDMSNRDYLDRNIPEFNPTEEKYLFLSYNRAPRTHRIIMIAKMIERGVFSNGLISLNKFSEQIYKKIINDNDEYNELIGYLYNNTPFLIDGKHNLINNLACNIEIEDYGKTFISVVTESLVENDTLFISEKTWKPIIVGHPFMIYGNPNTLKYLKSLGYRTFDKWIDESYDSEPNKDKRCDMIINELVRLNELSIDDLKSMREEMFEVCEYNKELFKKHLKQNWVNDVNMRLIDHINKIWNESFSIENDIKVEEPEEIQEEYQEKEYQHFNIKQRRYLPTLSDLIDRLSILQLKEVFIPEHKEEYAQEIKDVLHDIQICLDETEEITAEVIRAIVVLSQMNLHIWHNEANYRKGIEDGNNLELTHGLNGIRNIAKNMIEEVAGGRKDYKIDCLAENFKDWRISW